jgi:hypothetical protein
MRILAVTLLLTCAGLPALADPSPRASGPSSTTDPARMGTDDCARARKAGKTCVLDVAAEDVGGQTPTAGDTGTRALVFRPEGSLIRLRRDFIPEIVKTAEDL